MLWYDFFFVKLSSATERTSMDCAESTALDRREISSSTLEKLRTTILKQFASASYQDVGIRQICNDAGVSPKTVYKYFGNKDEMLFACVRGDLEALHQRCLNAASEQTNPGEQLDAFFDCWCEFYFSHRDVAAIIFLTIPQRYWVGERSFVQASLHQLAETMLIEGQQARLVTNDIDTDLLREFIVGLAHRAMIRFLNDANTSPSEIKRSLKTAIRRLVAA